MEVARQHSSSATPYSLQNFRISTLPNYKVESQPTGSENAKGKGQIAGLSGVSAPLLLNAAY
jgi:hypothetical protein